MARRNYRKKRAPAKVPTTMHQLLKLLVESSEMFPCVHVRENLDAAADGVRAMIEKGKRKR